MLDLYQAAFTALAGRIAATEAQREVFWEQLHDTLQDKIQLKKKKKGGEPFSVPKRNSENWIVRQKKMPPLHPSSHLPQMLRLT